MTREFLMGYPHLLYWLVSYSQDVIESLTAELGLDQKLLRVTDENEYKKLSTLTTPSEVLVVAKMRDIESKNFSKESWSVYFDDLQDPGNVGTIIRTGDWFGIRQFIFSPHSVDPYHPKAVQASMGSVFRCEFVQKNLVDYLSMHKELEINILGADLEGYNFENYAYPSSGILCLGNEGKGLGKGIQSILSDKVFIPGGKVDPMGQKSESLNVAVAAGILMSKVYSNKKKEPSN
jgi:TrmH family RNA methyltransferase